MIKAVAELEAGMLVETDVEARGSVLLKASTVLTDVHIQRLKRWNIPTINIISEEDRAKEDQQKENADEILAERKNAVEGLFAPFTENEDMSTLKECIITMLEGKYGN